MIVGTGVDLIDLLRVERALMRHGERFRARVFTSRERADCERRRRPLPHLALRFAAKEAAMKALGTGWAKGVRWLDIEVREAARGFELVLSGHARELAQAAGCERIWLGAASAAGHALAEVVLEGRSEADGPCP